MTLNDTYKTMNPMTFFRVAQTLYLFYEKLPAEYKVKLKDLSQKILEKARDIQKATTPIEFSKCVEEIDNIWQSFVHKFEGQNGVAEPELSIEDVNEAADLFVSLLNRYCKQCKEKKIRFVISEPGMKNTFTLPEHEGPVRIQVISLTA